MKFFFQSTLFILATMSSLMLVSHLTRYPLMLLILLAIIGMAGLLLQKRLYNKFLQQFKFIFDTLNIEIPNSIKNIYATGMELTFIFILASIGANPVTDLIEGKIKTNFTYNTLFFELALISAIFAIIPIMIYILYYSMKYSKEN
ncbi:hypothetical protein [Sporosarcina sp. UB5]|uniref:hypothetical protein n=1 Tax=Sporosarcina sp. UB5 TaxID=3047463 RepID=UPI003D798328